MSTIVREVVMHGMPKKLADQGWTLEKNDSTPTRFYAVNEDLSVDLGPYPQMSEAQDAAWNYKTDNSDALVSDSELPAPAEETSAAISVQDELGDNQLFPVDLIRVDGGTQPRAALDMHTVADYAEAMREGAVFPAVDVFYDGKAYWLADGFHRVQATKEAEIEEVHANVHAGTQRDALLFSLGANAMHGLPRTNADKRRAVTTMLMDEEWTRKSDGEIARQTRVSQPFVSGLRRELTTQNVLREQTVRTGADGVKRDTSNIGRRSEEDLAEEKAASPELFEGASEPASGRQCREGLNELGEYTEPPVDESAPTRQCREGLNELGEYSVAASESAKAPTAKQIDEACRKGFFVFIGTPEGSGDRRQIQGALTHYNATPAAKGNVWVSSEREWLEAAASEVTITDEPFSQETELEAELREVAEEEESDKNADARGRNPHGVYIKGVRSEVIGKDKERVTIQTVSDPVDGKWRASYSVDLSSAGCGSLPSARSTAHPTGRDAARAAYIGARGYLNEEMKRNKSVLHTRKAKSLLAKLEAWAEGCGLKSPEKVARAQQRAEGSPAKTQDPAGWPQLSIDIAISIRPAKSGRRNLTITGRANNFRPASRELATESLEYEMEYGLSRHLVEVVDELKSHLIAANSNKQAAARLRKAKPQKPKRQKKSAKPRQKKKAIKSSKAIVQKKRKPSKAKAKKK